KDDTVLPGGLFKSELANGVSRTDSTRPGNFAEVEEYYVQGGPEFYFGRDNIFKIDGSFRNRESDSFASGSWGKFMGNTEIDTVAVSPQVVVKVNSGGIENTLTVGYDYQNIEEAILNDSIFFGDPSLGDADLEREQHGVYVYDELLLGSRLTLSGGYRRDRADFDFKSLKEEVVFGVPQPPDLTVTDTTTRESAVTGGFNYRYGERSYAYLGASKGFRYPLFDEFFNFGPNTLDENLKPQKTKSYEVGLRQYFSENSYVHLNLFQLDTEEEIFFNPSAFANENLDGKTRRAGAELSFTAQPAKRLAVNGSYTYLDTEIEDGSYHGSEIPDVPNHKATLGATIDLGRGVTLALTGIYIGERPFVSDFPNDFEDQDDYVVLNAKLKYEWKQLGAFVDVRNLTGNDYAEYGVIGFRPSDFALEEAFYPSPKVNVLFGVSATF
ncbi:MAG: TonB-dependent receptor, partial [bacterium]|nr:TonB-dependent receptor [bacterium]